MQGFVCKRLWGKTMVTLNMSSLGTIFQPIRINFVPDVKCFCNNKNVLRAQSMVWHFVRHPVNRNRNTQNKIIHRNWNTQNKILRKLRKYKQHRKSWREMKIETQENDKVKERLNLCSALHQSLSNHLVSLSYLKTLKWKYSELQLSILHV